MTKKLTHSEYEHKLNDCEIDFWPIEQYVNSNTPILHECVKGHQWKVRPARILAGGGCPQCSYKVPSTEDYNNEILQKGIITLDEYVNSRTAINHICTEGHVWKATPSTIRHRSGCPICNRQGFDPTKPAILYYIRIGHYYKIGITTRTVAERFRADKDKPLIVIAEIKFDCGRDARIAEQALLKQVNRVTVPGYLKSGGNTELFLEPIGDSYIQGLVETTVSAVSATKL